MPEARSTVMVTRPTQAAGVAALALTATTSMPGPPTMTSAALLLPAGATHDVAGDDGRDTEPGRVISTQPQTLDGSVVRVGDPHHRAHQGRASEYTRRQGSAGDGERRVALGERGANHGSGWRRRVDDNLGGFAARACDGNHATRRKRRKRRKKQRWRRTLLLLPRHAEEEA